MAAAGLTNTLPRSSCGKCVKVLKELISGLDDENDSNPSKRHQQNGDGKSSTPHRIESPPLTLLRAIARSSQQHPNYDQWGQEKWRMPVSTNYATKESSVPSLQIEETEDGVKLTIPVETTSPSLMRRWTQLEQPNQRNKQSDPSKMSNGRHDPVEDEIEDLVPLATSVQADDRNTNPNLSLLESQLSHASSQKSRHGDGSSNEIPSFPERPLTIELKCRKCETTGPEAGARAFLMGPDPLSIVLCHNRIHSDRQEIEEILTHELVHLYDVQTLQLDLADCETVAYSEVRAAREAECSRGIQSNKAYMEQRASESTKGQTPLHEMASNLKESFSAHIIRPYCVKSIALGATQNMFPQKGKACLHKVWETAYTDHRPFASQSGGNESSSSQATADSEGSSRTYTMSGTIHGASEK